jgi:opacity protein-like surface antigen
MRKMVLLACLAFAMAANAQDDLLTELDTVKADDSGYATAAFKGLQIVTLQTTKIPAKNEFYFLVSHRFGTVKDGISEFFGLDMATTKIGGVYGITEWLSVNASRHTMLKVYETGVKYRLARQGNSFPLEIVGYNTLGINTFLEEEDYPKLEFADRLTYTSQLLISHKVSDKVSLELVPTYIHKNLYDPAIENDSQFALGAGGRVKLTRRLSLNMEYVYNADKPDFYVNPLSVGLDIETGGHIFQLLFTNSQSMTESGYITNAAGDWGNGDFFFGFNLYRVF